MSLKTRLYFTALVTFSIWALLLWNHFHGGVPRHHILAKKDLPSVSNWWGGLVLPLLSWLLLYRIHIRIARNEKNTSNNTNYLRAAYYGFAGALLFGVLLSVFFTYGYTDISGYMILTLVPVGLFVPLYRPEYLLGFVVGMTYTFGAVLPTAIGTILVLAGSLLYVVLRAGALYLVSRFAGKPFVR